MIGIQILGWDWKIIIVINLIIIYLILKTIHFWINYWISKRKIKKEIFEKEKMEIIKELKKLVGD